MVGVMYGCIFREDTVTDVVTNKPTSYRVRVQKSAVGLS